MTDDGSPGATTLTLPSGVIKALRAEARVSRKPVADLVLGWLQNQSDSRAIQKAELASKGRPRVKAADLYKQCGL